MLDAGSGMERPDFPKLFEKLPCRDDACFRVTKRSWPSRLKRITSSADVDITSRVIAERADIRHCVGRRCRRYLDGTGEFISGTIAPGTGSFLLRRRGF